MPKLTIATGLQEYSINDKFTVVFNPTDPNFVERVFNAFNDLDEKMEGYRSAVAAETDNAKVFDIARKMDAEMRGIVDGTLGEGLCDAVFGSLSVYASADGLPLWANLMLGIIDEMDDAFAREKKASNPRIKKYTEKFKKAG